MTVGVIIPTYRRPDRLIKCLAGLRVQQRAADEVLVIAKSNDLETLRVLAEIGDWPALKVVSIDGGGAVNQYNRGIEASVSEILAITDDDSIPRPDWLKRIEDHLVSAADLGGVGGRDFVQERGVLLDGAATTIGVVQWFGRVTGNHHIGVRKRPSVDILKGVNMAFRRKAIGDVRFETDLRGGGAQTCLDMAFSFCVQKRGWRLMFDPEVAVDHFPAPRFDADQRAGPNLEAVENNAFNFYLTLRRHMRPGMRRNMALMWAWAVGVKRSPGVLRGMVSRARRDAEGVEMRRAALRAWKATEHMEPRAAA